jgi:hypothetical protein
MFVHTQLAHNLHTRHARGMHILCLQKRMLAHDLSSMEQVGGCVNVQLSRNKRDVGTFCTYKNAYLHMISSARLARTDYIHHI